MADELMGMPQQYDQEEQQPVVDNQSTTQKGDNPSPVQPTESQKEQNWRLMRDRAEAAERRAQELERFVQNNMNQQQNTKLQIVEEDDDIDISDDAYIEGKQLKKYVKNLKKELKDTKKQFEEYNQKSVVSQAELRLKSQFSDFDQIVSKDNLEKLASQKPSLFRSIMANPDIYDQGYAAYEMIKGSGIVEDTYTHVDKRLEDNKLKPRSAANAAPQTGETPLARVGDYDRRVLSEERKDQLRRQVEEAKRLR